ncbi:SPOR domain-containing protein [candidate division WOR-3 bacterium]|nr:SPOR domain-containing protein [candidate division WOR-3 bacterium]
MKYCFCALIVVLLAVGCAKKQAVAEEGSLGDVIFEEISGDDIDTSSIIFEEETPEETTSTSFLEDLEGETTPFVSKPVKRQGFRVQIAAYQSQADANSAADRARGSLGRSVYVQYIAPYYKVRVGNFTSKYEATQYRDQIRGATSYRDAWVVPSEIIVE